MEKLYVLVIAVLLCVSYQTALSLELDTLEDIGPNETEISQRIIDGVTVQFSVAHENTLKAGTYYDRSYFCFGGPANNKGNDPLNAVNVSGDRFISIKGPAGPDSDIPTVTFDFSDPIREFGFTTIDLLENRGGPNDWIEVFAYNDHGEIIDQQRRDGPQGGSGLDLDWVVSSDWNEIVQVQMLTYITNFSGNAIDDIYVDHAPVPEPATMVLFSVGFIGVIFFRRRR